MNRSKALIFVGLVVAAAGIVTMVYTVLDDEKTSTTIRNVAFSFLIVGSFLSMYGKKLSGKNTKDNY